jgi:hypothetical protein
MVRPTLCAAALLGALLAPAVAGAKSISITILPSVEVKDGALTARVRLSNSGDEAAESVVPVLQFGEKKARVDAHPSLGPNESITATLSVDVGTLTPGRWPYRLAVDYTDANQYPFQALHVGVITVGASPPPSKVAVSEVKADPLSSSGAIHVRLKNLSAVERRAAVTIALPEGLEASNRSDPVTLAAWQETTVSVPVVNRAALAGSHYPIFAAVEYDEEAAHQTVVAQTVIEILSAQSLFHVSGNTFIVIAGVLGAVWLGFMLRQVTARRAA